jgi:hypothetical protein
MLAGIRVVLLAAVPLLGQRTQGLLERIRGAPLPEEQRQAVAASLSAKDFARIEAILAGTAGVPPASKAELGALLGAIEFVGGRMNQAVQAFRRSRPVHAGHGAGQPG